jgi:hypothetical protein
MILLRTARQAGRHHAERHVRGVDQAVGDGSRDGQGQERADEVECTRNRHRGSRSQRPGGDRCRHRVACVVEAVGEVESKRRDDHQHEHGVVSHNGDGKSRLVSSEDSQMV